jgi:hypothetical protein
METVVDAHVEQNVLVEVNTENVGSQQILLSPTQGKTPLGKLLSHLGKSS